MTGKPHPTAKGSTAVANKNTRAPHGYSFPRNHTWLDEGEALPES
jgi:hypothetical protein